MPSGEENESSQSEERLGEEKRQETSGWTEHVWSTFIDRGFSEDVTEKEDKERGKRLISKFQQSLGAPHAVFFSSYFYHS